MQASQTDRNRRACLTRLCRIAGLSTAALCFGASPPAVAKAAKSDFMYQDHSRDGKSCNGCRFFAPDATSPEMGTCAVVEGAVRSNGWCMAFAPRRQ